MLISNTVLTNFATRKVSEVSVPIIQKSDAVIMLVICWLSQPFNVPLSSLIFKFHHEQKRHEFSIPALARTQCSTSVSGISVVKIFHCSLGRKMRSPGNTIMYPLGYRQRGLAVNLASLSFSGSLDILQQSEICQTLFLKAIKEIKYCQYFVPSSGEGKSLWIQMERSISLKVWAEYLSSVETQGWGLLSLLSLSHG